MLRPLGLGPATPRPVQLHGDVLLHLPRLLGACQCEEPWLVDAGDELDEQADEAVIIPRTDG